jgi:hypothetical protein
MNNNKRKNTQAFWLVSNSGAPEKLERINTLIGMATELIKRNMKENDFRFITPQKKKYIQLWVNWFKADKPELYANKTTIELLDKIAEEIFSGYSILHRKNNGNVYLPERPINSRNSQRLKYSIKKTLEAVINS